MRVAILGLSESRKDAPTEGWERWGLAWDADSLRFERVFEMHDSHTDMPADYAERLSYFSHLYTQDSYPFNKVVPVCGDYFESSVAYMLALAIAEGVKEVGLWGVDMASESEYGYQKPNMEYLIGLARGKGIKVFIPETSPLLKFSGQFGYVGRYGRNH